jgi:hypothetical protein
MGRVADYLLFSDPKESGVSFSSSALQKTTTSTHRPEAGEKLPPAHEDYKNDTGIINAGTFAFSIYSF